MQQQFAGALLIALTAASTWGCGSDSTPTTPSATATTTTNSGTVNTPAPPVTTPTPLPASSVSDPGGEWNLTTPFGLPRGGCVPVKAISGNALDWNVQAVAGHPHRILLQAPGRGRRSPVARRSPPAAT